MPFLVKQVWRVDHKPRSTKRKHLPGLLLPQYIASFFYLIYQVEDNYSEEGETVRIYGVSTRTSQIVPPHTPSVITTSLPLHQHHNAISLPLILEKRADVCVFAAPGPAYFTTSYRSITGPPVSLTLPQGWQEYNLHSHFKLSLPMQPNHMFRRMPPPGRWRTQKRIDCFNHQN